MSLMHKGSVKLETDRLIIRKYSLNDANEFFDNWASSPKNTKGLAWEYHKSLEETEHFIRTIIKSYQLPNNYSWMVTLKSTGECVGCIGLYFIDEFNMSAQIGYCFGDKYKNNGYATEVANKILEFCFDEIGFNRIEAAVAVWNDASVRVAEKCNMVFEGILRQKYYLNPTGFEDFLLYAILKDEYTALRKNKADKDD